MNSSVVVELVNRRHPVFQRVNARVQEPLQTSPGSINLEKHRLESVSGAGRLDAHTRTQKGRTGGGHPPNAPFDRSDAMT